jgi:nucleoid-associated protein
MQLTKAVIHLIDKEQGTNPRLDKSSATLSIDANSVELAERLNEAFKRDEKVLKTEFVETKNVFQTNIEIFSRDSSTENFMEFTKRSLDRMGDLMSGNNFATGGYFVYMEYKYRNTNYLAVFMVRDSEEIIFKKTDSNNYTVNTTTIVDTSKLAMAVRVNYLGFINNQKRYLHYTKRQQHQSDYFIRWIEADMAEKSIDDTKALLKIIDSLDTTDLPVKPESGERYSSEEFRNHLYDFINSSGRLVRVRDLSRTFWDNENFLSEKAEDFNIDINGEFQAALSILKQLKKYELKSGKIKISFSKADKDRGRVRRGDNNQIIIDSEEIRRKFDGLE